MGNTLEILQLRLVKASIMKVVFVLFVAMAAVEMSFALKCNYGQSKGKDDFFMVETCHPNVNKCVSIKLNHNGKTIYQAACDENEAEEKLTCNEKKPIIFSRELLGTHMMYAVAVEIIAITLPMLKPANRIEQTRIL